MPLSDFIGMFGKSDDAPVAIRNRYAAPIQTSGRRLAVNTLDSLRSDIPAAFNAYNAFQPKQEALAGQQEGVLNTLLNRQLAYDPNQSLRDIFSTAFSQIDPNIIGRLSQGDVNRAVVQNRALGINSGAIRSTADDLMRARVSSGRYYDLARNVFNVVPTLFNSVYQQGLGSNQAAAGYVPGISAAYEAVANRPMQGVLNRINAARQGQAVEGEGIAHALQATQGYLQPTNWADKLSKTLKADEATTMQLAQMALSLYSGGALGGAGGGLGSLLGGMGGGQSQPSGTPAYGSQYAGAGGLYSSVPTYGGGGYSQPMF